MKHLKTHTTMLIFGGTGDLTHRKLIPGLFQLYIKGYLPKDFSLISIGRRDKTTEEYRKEIYRSTKKYSTKGMDKSDFDNFSKMIEYFKLDFDNESDYIRLKKQLDENYKVSSAYANSDINDNSNINSNGNNNSNSSSNKNNNRNINSNNNFSKLDMNNNDISNDIKEHISEKNNIKRSYMFYLAVSPNYFSSIVKNLKSSGIRDIDSSWQRLLIEKPFGQDLKSASKLNETISKVFDEKDIYRIDHYVAKEMIQNINILRFQNSIFGSIWNKDHISNVQISVLEKEGIGTRGGYYDNTGALRDMIQNHLLQLLAITAMEPPLSLDPDDIRNEKVKVFKALRHFKKEDLKSALILGQYTGYTKEDKVNSNSSTETLVASKLFIDNERWQDVPFYLLTGKALEHKTAQVTIEFKNDNKNLYNTDVKPNILVIKIQPDEGITLNLNVKKPGVIDEMGVAEMDYCQSCLYLFNSPDSYEKLLLDAMLGDSTLFTRWDELQLTWKYIDSLLYELNSSKKDHIEKYDIGSSGPDSLDNFIDAGAKKWWYRDREY